MISTFVVERLAAFETRYNQTAKPFKWKFTTTDLADLLDRLDRPAPTRRNPAPPDRLSLVLRRSTSVVVDKTETGRVDGDATALHGDRGRRIRATPTPGRPTPDLAAQRRR
jgi:hypothetical protein